ncbi:MAG: energy transducer TonB [Chitinophagaceae bacterium]|jgi:protein TonB|nr:energy transducer TonB [Chitinophagaceae bacterium]OQY96108.1 MAG: hypothetical protein B6D37_03080 [Sphingobacteriales bacterium UTBCD1]
MDATKILSSSFLDLVFENRNKEYGAYYLRRTYKSRITSALIFSFSIVILAYPGSLLMVSKKRNTIKMERPVVTVQDVKQGDEKKIESPKPKSQMALPAIEMKRFSSLITLKMEDIHKPPPDQDDLKDAKIGLIDKNGPRYENIATPAEIDDTRKIVREKKKDEGELIIEIVEIEAKFPGGDAAWRKYLVRNLSGFDPADHGAPAGTYTTVVQFVVDKEGNISDVKPLTNLGYGMEEEAVKVIQNGPKWDPAIQNGRKVKAYRKQPITFVVQEN